MVKSIIQRLFSRGESLPPETLRINFKKRFPNAINDAWFSQGAHWEVVFHDQSRERIARFDGSGALVEISTNTALPELPVHILSVLDVKGEIMNAITIDNKGRLTYEIIYRNDRLERFLMNLEEDGTEISCRKL